jgi:hypothetical protein
MGIGLILDNPMWTPCFWPAVAPNQNAAIAYGI